MKQEKHIRAADAAPVVIVGSVAYDTVMTPLGDGERILGGAAFFGAYAASFFAPPRLVGVVGKDFHPDHTDYMQRKGIDLEGLQHEADGLTFFWRGRYFDHFRQRETLETHLNAFEHFRPELPESYRSSEFAMLATIDPKLQMHVLDQLEGDPFILSDTIEYWIHETPEALKELMKRVDLFVIDINEAQQLTGEHNIIIAGHKLREMGPRQVILKKGEHGSVLFHDEGLFSVPAFPVTEVRDPTGAGDTYAGALIGYLAAMQDTSFHALKQGMLYATATASLTVEAFSSTRFDNGGFNSIQDRFEQLQSMMTIEATPAHIQA